MAWSAKKKKNCPVTLCSCATATLFIEKCNKMTQKYDREERAQQIQEKHNNNTMQEKKRSQLATPKASKTETVGNKFSDSLNTCIMRCKTFEPLPVSENYTPC